MMTWNTFTPPDESMQTVQSLLREVKTENEQFFESRIGRKTSDIFNGKSFNDERKPRI